MAKTKKLLGVGVLVGVLVACGSDVAEEAGDMMRGAGEAIADAGAALADSGEAQASTDAGQGVDVAPTVIDATCDLERQSQATGGSDEPIVTTERWSSVAVSQERIRTVWGCGFTAGGGDECSGASTCPGAQIPDAECKPLSGFRYAAGKVWVRCAGFTTVRVIAD